MFASFAGVQRADDDAQGMPETQHSMALDNAEITAIETHKQQESR